MGKTRKKRKWRERAIRESEGRCSYCGYKFAPAYLVADHVVPKSRGGGDGPRNLRLSCRWCDKEKEDRTAREFTISKYGVSL